jgi:dihydrofolate reductase
MASTHSGPADAASLHLTAVVAMTPGRVIGLNGSLPWHLPADLAFFKKTTSGHPIVMGRKTYDSIGRPLPKRRNIVLTRDPRWTAEGVEVIHTPQELYRLPEIGGQVFIIGGSEIYGAFMPYLAELLISHLSQNYPGDTFFPEFESHFPYSDLIESHPEFTVRRHGRTPLTQK